MYYATVAGVKCMHGGRTNSPVPCTEYSYLHVSTVLSFGSAGVIPLKPGQGGDDGDVPFIIVNERTQSNWHSSVESSCTYLLSEDHITSICLYYCFRRQVANLMPLNPVLGYIDSVAPFITVDKRSQSNQDFSFHLQCLLPEYHRNMFML